MASRAYLVVTASFRTSLLWHSSFNVTLDLQDGVEHRRNDFARVVSTAPSHASLYEVASFSVRTRSTLQRTTEKHSRRDQNCRKNSRNKKWSSRYRELNEASLIIEQRLSLIMIEKLYCLTEEIWILFFTLKSLYNLQRVRHVTIIHVKYSK